MFSHLNEVEMTRRYRHDHDILNLEAEELLSISNNLNEDDIFQYIYPDDKEINSIGIRGIYLGNYIRWDPLSQHLDMVRKFGYKGSNFNRTFDCYDYVDCFNYMNLHDYLKICKHGYSKVTDHVCREIRHKRITREEGVALVKKYELISPQYLDLFCKWLGINDPKSLNYIINRFRNKLYWEEYDVDKWRFKGLSESINKDYKKNSFINGIKKIDKYFLSKESLEKNKKPKYIVFGKGID